MFNDNIPYCIRILSKLINSQIHYTTSSISLQNAEEKKLKNFFKKEFKNSIFCVCENMLAVINENLEGIKREIKFENIESIVLDLHYDKVIQIILKQPLQENQESKKISLIFVVENRENLIEKIKDYYTIHFSKKYTRYQNVNISYTNNILKTDPKPGDEKLLALLNDNKKQEMENRTPKESKFRSYNNYNFYLKHECEIRDTNIFYYSKKSLDEGNARLILEIGEETPIEHLNANPDISDFSFYCYNKFFNYMNYNFKKKSFWINCNTPYFKKMNLSKDKSEWEGWRIECREKPKDQMGLNYIFIFLRRKYIPPFFETYQNICLILVEEYYEETRINMTSKAYDIIEAAADSMTPVEYHTLSEDCYKLIQIKLDSFLVDSASLDFFYNKLNLTSDESYLVGLNYTLAVVIFLSQFLGEKISNLKSKILEKIQNIYFHNGKSFNRELHEISIKNNIGKAPDHQSDYYLNMFTTNPEEMSIWLDKKNDYIVSCVDGLLTHNSLNLRTLITWLKDIPEMRVTSNPHIEDLLFIRIVSTTNETIEPKINSIMNNIYKIKNLYFNEKIMCLLIEKDYLKILHDIRSDFTYSKFLEFLLERHFSNKLFIAIYFYLKSLSKGAGSTNEENSENLNNFNDNLNLVVKSSLNNLLPHFLKIYSNELICPTLLTIACRGLSIFTKFDHYNKTILINENCIRYISTYLSSPDEKLVYYSAELLFNIIRNDGNEEGRDNFAELFKKYPNVFTKILKFFKGNFIPGEYYSSKTILLISNIVLTLIKVSQSEIKEMICEQNNRKFVKYLLNYLQADQSTIPKEINQKIKIQEKIYEILSVLVTRNGEFKIYLEDTFRILKIVDIRCEINLEFLETLIGFRDNAQELGINKPPIDARESEYFLNMVMSQLEFLDKFISKNTDFIRNVRLNCPCILKMLVLFYENQKKDKCKHIYERCKSLFEILVE